jgi:hypothetical protein
MTDHNVILLNATMRAGRRVVSAAFYNAILDAVIAVAVAVFMAIGDSDASVLNLVVLGDLVATNCGVWSMAVNGLSVPLALLDCDGSHGCYYCCCWALVVRVRVRELELVLVLVQSVGRDHARLLWPLLNTSQLAYSSTTRVVRSIASS